MIPHALDIFGDEMQVHASRDVARIFHHVGQELTEKRIVHRVDVLVAVDDLKRQFSVALDIAVERILHHRLDLARHATDGNRGAVNRLHLHQHTGPLGQVLGIVAAPLKVRRDLQDRKYCPQIACGRRAQRDQARGSIVDHFFKVINGLVI